SSRRRHTWSKRDWSSDVCSSDLHAAPAGLPRLTRWASAPDPLGFRAWLGGLPSLARWPGGGGAPMRCPPPPARGRGRLGLAAGPGPGSLRPPARSAKVLLFAAEATALQSSVCATPAEPGRCHAHRAQSGPRQRYEPRAARDGRDAGDTVLTPREPLRPGPTA